MTTPIVEFLRTGEWTVACEDQPHQAWSDALQVPSAAMSLLWDPTRRTRLKNEGWSPSEIQRFIGPAVRRALEGLDFDLEFRHSGGAIFLLLARSLEDPAGQAAFPIGDQAQRQAWLKSSVPTDPNRDADLSWMRELSPAMLLRLAVNPGSIASRDPEVRSWLSTVILHAVGRMCGSEAPDMEARFLLAAMRVWVLSNEGDDLDDLPDVLFSWFGVNASELHERVEAIRSGTAGASVFQAGGGRLDLDEIKDRPLCRESVEFYGGVLDAQLVEQSRLVAERIAGESDPWVLVVLREIAEGGPDQGRILDRHPDVGVRGLSRVDAVRIRMDPNMTLLGPDAAGSLLDADIGSTFRTVYDALFRRSLETALVGGTGAVRNLLEPVGLTQWFEMRLKALESAPAEASRIVPNDRTRADLAAKISHFEGDVRLQPLAKHIRTDARKALQKLDRHEAEALGLGWFQQLVVSLVESEGAGFALNRLPSEDMAVLKQCSDGLSAGVPGWWRVELDPAMRMRLLEFSCRAGIADPAMVHEASEVVANSIARSTPARGRERFLAELDACRRSLISEDASVRPKLLEAFRRGDEVGFLEIFETPRIDLPRPHRLKRVLDTHAWVLIALICLPAIWVLARWGIAGQTPISRRDSVLTSSGDEVRLPTLSVERTRWRRVPNSTHEWFLIADQAELDEYFGDGILDEDLNEQPPVVAREFANEFRRRVDLRLRHRFIGGITSETGETHSWDTLRVHLPRASDVTRLRTLVSLFPATVWLDDGTLQQLISDRNATRGSIVLMIDKEL